MKNSVALLFLMPTLLVAVPARQASEADERASIERAALDYIEAIYEGRPELIRRSVHPDVVKVGYSRRDEEDIPIRPMSFEKLLGLASEWSTENDVPADALKDVTVLDRFHDIATVRLTASWGVDYMMLARSAGRWKIIQVLYQSNPK